MLGVWTYIMEEILRFGEGCQVRLETNILYLFHNYKGYLTRDFEPYSQHLIVTLPLYAMYKEINWVVLYGPAWAYIHAVAKSMLPFAIS